ncbi:MAG: 23S rRNA (guanosine(2251)-2'-O)-methyltransferase RlmB [Lactobacillaceae bacterium]|jgi:23S rRNA (guanosine2251-2'-O)-methyltransferase|nr:23S rRNA (guanosine(2251)-2'-O)-methyltransferase RlmB [Lactobacillaceae bacterium]
MAQTENIFGMHAVLETLKNNSSVQKIYISDSLKADRKKQILEAAPNIEVEPVKNSTLDKMSQGQNHQGVMATIEAYSYASIDEIFAKAKKQNQDPFIVILDEIEDPHNLGSILRTSDAAGVSGIIIPDRRAVQLTPTVAKTSTGAIEHVPVAKVKNLNNAIDDLKKRGVWIFGTDMNGTKYTQWDAKGPVAIIIGNEGRGISPLTKKKVDEMLTIPMVGHVQSLNASVAAALLIYQGFNSRQK